MDLLAYLYIEKTMYFHNSNCATPTGGGHIAFGADPFSVGVSELLVCTLSSEPIG